MARVGIFLITVALIAGMVGCGDGGPAEFAGGSGITSDPYQIADWHHLHNVRNYRDSHFILVSDLDSTTADYTELGSPTASEGKGWQPIGTEDDPFTGTFDGQGYEIRDLFINRPNEDYVGLFSRVDGGGVIRNLGVVDADVTGYAGVGGLAGSNGGNVSNSYSTGSLTGDIVVGGLVGANDGNVSNSYSAGSLTGGLAGGLVGANDPVVFDSGAPGAVSNSYYNYDEVLINGENIITIGALSGEDFEEWLANDKFLDVNERLSQENGYYAINDVSDFKQLLAFGQDSSLKFRLKNDLDLATAPSFYIPYLAGQFDGNGHEISNLSFSSDLVQQVGLFGYLAPSGNISGVGVVNVNITGSWRVGGLVGYTYEGTVSMSYSTGSVTGGMGVGGLGVGGLVGWSEAGTVSNSYSTGSVTGVTGSGGVGGLVGYNYEGTVSNSYSTGDVTGGTGSGGVGGLVGYNYEGTVSNSYSTGDVTGGTGSGGVGGLVGGSNIGTVSDSYSTGNVTGDSHVGGLVGVNGGTVSDSYSTGSVTGNNDVGGLVGGNEDGTVSNSFWDIETSGQATSDGGTGKTTAEMQDITTFSGAAWNIIAVANPGTRNPSYIWNIVDDVTYPFLSWQPVV